MRASGHIANVEPCVYTADTYDSHSHRSGHIYHEIQAKKHSSGNSLQVPYFLIRRAAKKLTFIADLRTIMRVCECVCIGPTADTYDSRSHRSGNIYHEIQVKNHSSGNSLQVPYFLIRRTGMKVIIIIIIRQPLCPVVGRRPQHAISKLACLVLSSAISCRSSICPGRLSTAWLVSLVVFSCHMVSMW